MVIPARIPLTRTANTTVGNSSIHFFRTGCLIRTMQQDAASGTVTLSGFGFSQRERFSRSPAHSGIASPCPPGTPILAPFFRRSKKANSFVHVECCRLSSKCYSSTPTQSHNVLLTTMGRLSSFPRERTLNTYLRYSTVGLLHEPWRV